MLQLVPTLIALLLYIHIHPSSNSTIKSYSYSSSPSSSSSSSSPSSLFSIMCSSKAKLVSNTNGAVRAPLLERRNNADASGLFLRSKTTDDEPKPGPSPSPSPRLKSLNKSKSFSYSVVEYEAGSIAAARREEVASFHERRRMRIAHYGRTAAAAKPSKAAVAPTPNASNVNEKRCTFITPNSGIILLI